MTDHPPKPRLTLRVGISGHRPDKLKSETVARVDGQLRNVFEVIAGAASAILKRDADVYADAPAAIRLVSGLAEGTDQMAVAAAPKDWLIEAILPFPKEEYLKDFRRSAAGDGRDVTQGFEDSLKRAAAVTEMPLPPGDNRDLGYVAAGGYLLRQIDVLIAVWDGEQPKPGGTGALAREAFDGGIPVVWLPTAEHPAPASDHAPRLIDRFDEKGAPIASRDDALKGPLSDRDPVNSPLAQALAKVFAAPSTVVPPHGRAPRDGLMWYYGEDWEPYFYLPFFDLLKRLANSQKPRFVLRHGTFADHAGEWDEFVAAAPAAVGLQARIKDVLLPRYLWADGLAVHFSHFYRGTYVLAYLLSALAVFVAAFGTLTQTLTQKLGFVLIEMALILVILGIVWYGTRLRWHERWLGYRSLAENLRHGRFLAFISEFGRINKAGSRDDSGQPWTLWYIRATMREIGVPTARLDGDYARKLLSATLTHEISGQIAYHEANRQSMHDLDHRLHQIATYFCFGGTLFVLTLFVVGYVYEWALGNPEALSAEKSAPVTVLGGVVVWLKYYMIVLTAGLPALGAALAGIRSQGDFEGSMERSIRTSNALTALTAEYKTAMTAEIGVEETTDMLVETAQIMSEDLASWEELYGRKRLALPA